MRKERFLTGDLPDGFFWFNEPFSYQSGAGLTITTRSQTDFWQRTHYGFRRDDGHCLFTDVAGDFSLETRVEFTPLAQYDQCGLMIRVDSENWIKCSTEFENNEISRLGSVVTNLGFSDWATQDISSAIRAMSYRISRSGSDFRIEASTDGEAWKQMRIAHLHECTETIQVGVYSCSPIGERFTCTFQYIGLGESQWASE